MTDRNNIPPKLARKLLNWLVRDDLTEEVLGDLEELFYKDEKEKSHFRAKLNYWYQTFNYLRPFAIRKSKLLGPMNYGMYRSNLKIGYRNLLRNKWYSMVNVGGLAVGLGVCLVICQYIYFELNYDKFHDNYKDTYRLVIEETNRATNDIHPYSSWSLGVSAKAEIPEIKEFVRKERCSRGSIITNPSNKNVFHEDPNDVLFVDNSFFEVFNFPLKLGNKDALFLDTYSMVITEEAAQKYFGTQNPLGKTLVINAPPSPGNYTVTGVLETPPLNSHLQFKFLIPMENYIEFGWGGAVKDKGGWEGFSVVTYLEIDSSANLEIVSEKLNQIIADHKAESKNDIVQKTILQPISDIYLKSGSYTDPGFLSKIGNMKNIRIFLIVSIFILVLAWVNYINLSTARSIHRSKEVGIRKSIGAFKGQLIGQFMMESLLVNAIAAILAIGMAFLTMPVLSKIIGKELGFGLLGNPTFWVWFIGVVLFGSLLSGLYPGFVLSNLRPLSVLRSTKVTRIKGVNLRNALITFQFLISLLLISGTYLVYKQTSFMKSSELGIDIEKILILRGAQVGKNRDSTISKFPAYRNKMIEYPSISSVAASFTVPGEFWESTYRRPGDPESSALNLRGFSATTDFAKTYGLEFIAGKGFTDDMNDLESIIVNEEAVRAFGLGSPEEAIQQTLMRGERKCTIVGVVKNFHWHSLAERHTPYSISLFNNVLHPYISVRINTSDIQGSLAHINSTYSSFFPGNSFDYFFADEAFNSKYQSEVQFGKLFSAFSALAIFIACIGLFALVSFSAVLRVKEIGVRKVLGASTQNLMMLLSKEYLKLLLIAIVVAAPLIIYLAGFWLENYAFRISIGLDLLLVPSLVLLVISLLTVGHRTHSTAKTNPVESLKVE